MLTRCGGQGGGVGAETGECGRNFEIFRWLTRAKPQKSV
jgi:hypothetical protein